MFISNCFIYLFILAHGLFSWDIVKNWSNIKVERMYEVLKIKFSNDELKQKLLATGNSILIENSKSDSFWGIGKKAFEEMDAELGRITSIKVESLFDVAPDPEPIGRERILIRRWEK